MGCSWGMNGPSGLSATATPRWCLKPLSNTARAAAKSSTVFSRSRFLTRASAAFFSAAIGSALGDLIAGYPVYIAPTFVIKGMMGLVAALIMSKSHAKNIAGFMLRLLACILAELIMVGGYFAF